MDPASRVDAAPRTTAVRPGYASMQNRAWRTGISFGLTSGVITTLGLMVGLHSGTHSRLAVIGGVLTIAVADALSDALGIHIAEESQHGGDLRHIWTATLATFLAKFVVAATFVVPILLFVALDTAVLVSVAWGLALLALLSWRTALAQAERPLPAIAEHLSIAIAVVILTHFLGELIARTFGE